MRDSVAIAQRPALGAHSGRPIPPLSSQQIAAFWDRVSIDGPDECWPWMGATTADGYGRLKIDGVLYSAHRIAAALSKEDIPPRFVVMHICDNPRCCNPPHLVVAQQRHNVMDMVRKGRANPMPGALAYAETKNPMFRFWRPPA